MSFFLGGGGGGGGGQASIADGRLLVVEGANAVD